MSEKLGPIYKCALNNRMLFAETFKEDAFGAELSVPVLIGKHHKNGGRELAIQALKIDGTKVNIKIGEELEELLFEGVI